MTLSQALSRYIIRNKADYYGLFQEVTTNSAWEGWICYMLQAVVETADWTSRKIRAIRNQMSHAAEHIRQQAPSIYSRELVDLIFSQPYCRIQNVVDAGLAKRQTASTYLKTLTEAGVLREIKVGRDKIFTHPHLLRLLTAEGNEPLDYN